MRRYFEVSTACPRYCIPGITFPAMPGNPFLTRGWGGLFLREKIALLASLMNAGVLCARALGVRVCGLPATTEQIRKPEIVGSPTRACVCTFKQTEPPNEFVE